MFASPRILGNIMKKSQTRDPKQCSPHHDYAEYRARIREPRLRFARTIRALLENI